ncbi:hypothetical protein L0244_40470, partial [bacterium]|nr:hypothetical protein [bacterium]
NLAALFRRRETPIFVSFCMEIIASFIESGHGLKKFKSFWFGMVNAFCADFLLIKNYEYIQVAGSFD